MILLPECFNSTFDTESLKLNAENFEDSVRKTPTLNFMRQYSKKFGVYLAGSIPEESNK
jgi:predicted amidohydrolase